MNLKLVLVNLGVSQVENKKHMSFKKALAVLAIVVVVIIMAIAMLASLYVQP